MTTDKDTGPVAELSGPVTTGHRIEPVSAVPIDLAGNGYVSEEFFAAGTASAFEVLGAPVADGTWSVAPRSTAAFRTRIVVRRPSEPERFNGTVLVEWFNVSGGVEAAPGLGLPRPPDRGRRVRLRRRVGPGLRRRRRSGVDRRARDGAVERPGGVGSRSLRHAEAPR